MSALPHVVILGGGFGGLQAALGLARAPVRVTLVDQNNHHLFQPLLYQVATAGLAVTDIAVPLRHVVRRQANTTVLMARAKSIDVARRVVVLEDGELAYDRLILATGAVGHWFGHDEWAQHALGLKDCREALEIRSRILLAFEAAERAADEAGRARHLSFAVIGGGPTGVELAGALAEIARVTLARNFRRFDPGSARVVLIEAGPRILPAFPEELARSAAAALARLGVLVRTGAPVTAIDGGGVELDASPGARERIPAATVLWAAGVRASPLTQSLGVPLGDSRSKRTTPRAGSWEGLFGGRRCLAGEWSEPPGGRCSGQTEGGAGPDSGPGRREPVPALSGPVHGRGRADLPGELELGRGAGRSEDRSRGG